MSINLLKETGLELQLLQNYGKKPPLWQSADPMWTDPYISTQMLEAHLDPELDAASRNHSTIKETVKYLINTLKLKPGQKVLDLGCGPGLYATLLAEYGLEVTGVDFSANSIKYAQEEAAKKGLDITYIQQDYLKLDYVNEFDAVLLIYCDLCPLSKSDRDKLLKIAARALKPSGYFAFDVTTHNGPHKKEGQSWGIYKQGFWSPKPHLVLTQAYYYPEESTYLDQYLVVQNDGKVKVYRNYHTVYSQPSIQKVVNAAGLSVIQMNDGLADKPVVAESKCLGVITQKAKNKEAK